MGIMYVRRMPGKTPTTQADADLAVLWGRRAPYAIPDVVLTLLASLCGWQILASKAAMNACKAAQ